MLDAKIACAKELISKREEIDRELEQLLAGTVKTRTPQRCSNCGAEGHSARTCTRPKPQ